jgi:hypothetical protein
LSALGEDRDAFDRLLRGEITSAEYVAGLRARARRSVELQRPVPNRLLAEDYLRTEENA